MQPWRAAEPRLLAQQACQLEGWAAGPAAAHPIPSICHSAVRRERHALASFQAMAEWVDDSRYAAAQAPSALLDDTQECCAFYKARSIARPARAELICLIE